MKKTERDSVTRKDEPMEQLFRPKLMFATPFFRLKIGRFKATVYTV
jgi:hypothetical protein